MLESNYYAPPEARPVLTDRRKPTGTLRMILRAIAVIGGFSLLTGPARSATETEVFQGQPFAKALGAVLMVAAFFPFGEASAKTRVRDEGVEEL